MSYRLSEASLRTAVIHLEKYGDTDVFPHLPEIAMLKDKRDDLITELTRVDLDAYVPSTAIEALAPKSRYGFRLVHQLPFIDTILLLAAVVEIGERIEQVRQPFNDIRAFSYRFAPDGNGGVFDGTRTYKHWLHRQIDLIKSNLTIKTVVATDISDFYSRVNFHRLDNLLEEVAPGNGAVRYIKRHIKAIRARQSFGLPVGGAGARLLAELALNDTDRSLENHGTLSTRFVDDFRLFLPQDENPYDALALIAEHLGIREGLSLNVDKTRIYSRDEYLELLALQTTDVAKEAEGQALDALVSGLYFDEEPDADDLAVLKHFNLLGLLQEEIGNDKIDMGRVKLIFRALRIAKPEEAVEFLSTNLNELVVFAREMVLLMQELEKEFPGCFSTLSEAVVQSLLSPPSSSIQLIRTWLLELLVRRTVPLSAALERQLWEGLSTPLDRRQLLLIRGRLGNRSYFGINKTAYSTLSPFEQPCFIWGAACLPRDEYATWLGTVRPYANTPTAQLFLNWARENQSDMFRKLDHSPANQDD